jgi:prevent-host-death family protein
MRAHLRYLWYVVRHKWFVLLAAFEFRVPFWRAICHDLSKFLRLAEKEEIVITRHGRPAGVLVGFASEDDWFEYRLEHDPRFLKRIASARRRLQKGDGTPIEEVE